MHSKKGKNCNPSHSVQGDDLHELMLTCDSSYLRQDGDLPRQGREGQGAGPRGYWTGLPCELTGPPLGAEKEKIHHLRLKC